MHILVFRSVHCCKTQGSVAETKDTPLISFIQVIIFLKRNRLAGGDLSVRHQTPGWLSKKISNKSYNNNNVFFLFLYFIAQKDNFTNIQFPALCTLLFKELQTT